MRDSLRVLTWNIHGCVGTDGRRDPARIAHAIRALGPDILALQEVDSRNRHADGVDVFEYLMATLGGYGLDAKTLSTECGHYGQMLISRWPLAKSVVHDISVVSREPRRALDVRLDCPQGSLRVLATHFGLGPAERRAQFRAVADIVGRGIARPTILLGDFNEWRRRGAGYRLLSPLFERATTHSTFPSRCPLLPLDRIWCHPARLMVRSWTDRSQRRASDHLPLLAELSFAGGP